MNVPYWLHFRLHKKAPVWGLKIYSKEEFFHGKLAQFYEKNKLKWHTMWRNSVVTEKKVKGGTNNPLPNVCEPFLLSSQPRLTKIKNTFILDLERSKNNSRIKVTACLKLNRIHFQVIFVRSHQLFVRKVLTINVL